MVNSPSLAELRFQLPTAMMSELFLVKMGVATDPDRDDSMAAAVTAARARCSFSKNSPRFSLESDPPSGEPDEYIVASLPSKMNLKRGIVMRCC